MRPTTELRPATAADYPAVIALLEAAGLPTAGVPRALGDFLVADTEAGLAGAIGLERYGSGRSSDRRWSGQATGAPASAPPSSARLSIAPGTRGTGDLPSDHNGRALVSAIRLHADRAGAGAGRRTGVGGIPRACPASAAVMRVLFP